MDRYAVACINGIRFQGEILDKIEEMKNLKYVKGYQLLLLLSVACFSSCKDYLTVDVANKTVEEGYYDSPAKVEQAVVGIYVDLRRALLNNHAWLMYGESRVGDLTVQNAAQADVLGQKLTVKQAQVQQLTDWRYFYDVVYDANQTLAVLESVQKGVLTDYQYKLFKGEALALKSYAYFYLARVWGITPSAEKADFGSKLNQTELIGRAIVFAKEAQSLLPFGLLNDDGIFSKSLTETRFSKGSVTLLLAQEQLWLNQHTEAQAMLTAIFKELPTDSISSFNISMGVDRRQPDLTQRPLDAALVSITLDKLNTIYPVGDARRARMFTIAGTKASLIVKNQELLPLLDSKEIDLIAAELAWKSKNLATAKQLLKKAAAGAIENYDDLTENTFEEALLQERRRLLMGQGLWFFDLVRFAKVPTYVPILNAEDVKNGAAYWPLSNPSIVATGWSQAAYWLSK